MAVDLRGYGNNESRRQADWDPSESVYVQGLFGVLYTFLFLLGIVGNMMVITTVFCKKHMHTVTNFLITNLAMSDILTDCITVPFTPAISTLYCNRRVAFFFPSVLFTIRKDKIFVSD